MRLAHRTEATVFLVLAHGCAAAPSMGLRPMVVPATEHTEAFVSAALDRGLPTMIRVLAERGREGYRALRLGEAQMDGWLNEAAITRDRSTFLGMVPGINDRRWFAWRRWRGSVLLGWCARGVRLQEANGPEGFLQRTVLVERILVVGGHAEHRWAAWLEGVVLSQEGLRFAPWIPHAQSVEAPRRSHSDVDLWDCDLARTPPTSAPQPGE